MKQATRKKPARRVKTASSPSLSFTTFVASLGIARVTVTRPIPVTVRPSGDEFIATFFDANIGTGGDSPEEAIENLQSLIADVFELLDQHPEDQLGPHVLRQRNVLREFLCRPLQKVKPKRSRKN